MTSCRNVNFMDEVEQKPTDFHFAIGRDGIEGRPFSFSSRLDLLAISDSCGYEIHRSTITWAFSMEMRIFVTLCRPNEAFSLPPRFTKKQSAAWIFDREQTMKLLLYRVRRNSKSVKECTNSVPQWMCSPISRLPFISWSFFGSPNTGGILVT